jgi:hypothetical protein
MIHGSRAKKTAQICVRIDPSLKDAADRAAAEDSRSLTSLIEKLLTDHLRKRHHSSIPRRRHEDSARTALKLAAREIESVADKSLPPEEREGRKRQIIRGPKEFRGIRSDLPGSKR